MTRFSQKLFFHFLPYPIEKKFCNCSAANSYWCLNTMKIIAKMITLSPIRLTQGIFWVLHFSVGESDRGETQFCSNVAKSCFHPLHMNYWRYHCVSYVKKIPVVWGLHGLKDISLWQNIMMLEPDKVGAGTYGHPV